MFKRKLYSLFNSGIRGHFSQNGEDIVVRHYLGKFKTSRYLDLGAYHPFRLSNTALLWAEGWNGINLDANKNSIIAFRQKRPTDVSVHAALVTEQQKLKGLEEITFYLDQGDLAKGKSGWSARGSLIRNNREQIPTTVPTITVKELANRYDFSGIEYMNVDIEGYEMEILKEFDFKTFRPEVITVEDHQNLLKDVMSSNITSLLCSHGYDLIARVRMTSIFLKATT